MTERLLAVIRLFYRERKNSVKKCNFRAVSLDKIFLMMYNNAILAKFGLWGIAL